MSKLPKRIIIVASGWSIRNGDSVTLSKDLSIWNKIKNEYTIGLNYAFRYFEPTITTFVDFQFYVENKKELDDIPLIIGKYDGQLGTKHALGKNVILIPKSNKYYGVNSWEKGFYKGLLNGLFSLTLAIALGFKEIYLLGYDCNAQGPNQETHFYQNEINLKEKGLDRIKYQGIGKTLVKKTGKTQYNTSLYNNSIIDDHFEPYRKELETIQIFNVSEKSRIKTFPKLSYLEFYKRLEEDRKCILQSRAKQEIEEYILARIPK